MSCYNARKTSTVFPLVPLFLAKTPGMVGGGLGEIVVCASQPVPPQLEPPQPGGGWHAVKASAWSEQLDAVFFELFSGSAGLATVGKGLLFP